MTPADLFCLFAVLLLLWLRFRHALTLSDLAKLLAEEFGNFRGGPPTTPMHPLPVNDAHLLFKRKRQHSTSAEN